MNYPVTREIIKVLLAACFVLLLIAAANAQEIEYVGSYYLGGEFKGIHIDEPYAICGMNRGFLILDVSDPEAISPVGDNPFVGNVRRFTVSGAYAYATNFEQEFRSFFIIDIQDVEIPVITAVLDYVGRGELDISDDYAYILDFDEPVDIIDISDPYNPEIVGEYISGSYYYDISISGSCAYLSARDDGLEVLDISNPIEPSLLARYMSPTGIRIFEVFVEEPYAYITATEADGYGLMIEIVDISDPLNPAYVGHIGFGGFGVGDIFVKGDYIYAFQEWFWDGALFIIVNVEDRENPYTVWSNDFCSILDYLNVFVSDNRAYLTCDYSLTIMDVSDPSAPIEIGGYTSNPGLKKIVSSGNYAYGLVARDFFIFSVSDPASPEFVAAYDVASTTYDLKVVGNYAYVVEDGFEIIDVSNPESPTFVGEFETYYATSIDVRGNYAYLGGTELQIVDISDPGNPTLMGQCTVEWIEDVMVQDDLVFIARKPRHDNYGFVIADISDPTAPVLIGSCETPDAVSISVVGQYAYLAVGYDGIIIIDVSNPYDPDPIDYYDTPGFASDIYMNENFAYISDLDDLVILDISDPYHPALVTMFETPGAARSSYIAGEYICVADEYSLMILRFIGGPCEYIPGDCDHNGMALEMSDVLAMIGNYRGTVVPYYRCDCGVDPPGSYFAATADPNGNCVANELNDVVIEIGAYRGTAAVSGCPDCPGSE